MRTREPMPIGAVFIDEPSGPARSPFDTSPHFRGVHMSVPTRANDVASPNFARLVRPARARMCSAAAVLGVVIAALPAAAQCRVPENSNEAKLLAFYEAPIAFGVDAAPERLAPGAVRVSVEVEPMPTPNPALQQTHICFASKSDNTRLSPIFGRPRIMIGLPAGFIFEGSYVPPIQLYDAKPNLGSFALSRAQRLPASGGGALTLLLRAHRADGRSELAVLRDLAVERHVSPIHGRRRGDALAHDARPTVGVLGRRRRQLAQAAVSNGLHRRQWFHRFDKGAGRSHARGGLRRRDRARDEIGRASCRERGQFCLGGASLMRYRWVSALSSR